MNDFNKEHMLITYTLLQDMRDNEIISRDDYLERLETRGSRGFHTEYDIVLWKLESYAHYHGYFYWHHFEGDNCEYNIYTIEEMIPTCEFDIIVAEARFNEIQQMDASAAGPLIEEQGEISHEAHRNGLEFTWSNEGQRYVCTPLPQAGELLGAPW